MENINEKNINGIELSTDEKYKWYAIMCIPNHENAVKTRIDSEIKLKGLDKWIDIVHVPTMKEFIIKSGKRVAKNKVMIPGYILIHMDLTNGELIPTIRSTKGVSSWLNPTDGKKSNRPEQMRDRDVDRFLNVSVESEKICADFIVDEEVKVVSGHFSGFNGVINHIKGEKVRVLITIFGQETPTDLDMIDIEKII